MTILSFLLGALGGFAAALYFYRWLLTAADDHAWRLTDPFHRSCRCCHTTQTLRLYSSRPERWVTERAS